MNRASAVSPIAKLRRIPKRLLGDQEEEDQQQENGLRRIFLKQLVGTLRDDGCSIDESLLAHLSLVGLEHINLTGDYVWHSNKRIAKGRFRPLRKSQDSISRLFTANFKA